MNNSLPFKSVVKRTGEVVSFDEGRIVSAVSRAMDAVGEGDRTNDPVRVSQEVVQTLVKRFPPAHVPHIEEIQDAVEEALILLDFPKTAKAYILYRKKRAELRTLQRQIPERVKRLAAESKKYFRSALSEFIYYKAYSRWIASEGRRETWIETIDRYMAFMREVLGTKLADAEYGEVRDAILDQEVMPSMRLLWSAGKMARENNVACYNCSYIAPAYLRDFAEIMYILMCGGGVGFSVENQTVQQLPIIVSQKEKETPLRFVVQDSREGWCDALYAGLEAWFDGRDIEFDFSQLRPAGARLETMGGKSAGPEPLRHLLIATRQKVLARQGRRLKNIDVHDIICGIAEAVVVGGIRRSSLISLSDLDDEELRSAKVGQFYLDEPQRMMANNSAAYIQKPSAKEFLGEWLALAKSGTGERGIFNRGDLLSQIPERRRKTFMKDWATAGTNPCGEIILKSKQFCNLTEVVCRPEDTEEALLKKVRIATILGTYQATLTNFPYLSAGWKKNCEEERLLGVSLTGQWDCSAVRNAGVLRKLRDVAIETNKAYAARFEISPSLAITCIKPSGEVSRLVDAAAGMHPRHAAYYILRARILGSDALFKMLKDQKFPYHPETGQREGSATTYVFDFPVKAPENATIRKELSAIEQLEFWKMVKQNYTEHNPSVTISIRESEWIGAAEWLYENWSILGGLSFLPMDGHVYPLAPYEEITEAEYLNLAAKQPEIDFSQILLYEDDDSTMGAQTAACESNICELDPSVIAGF